MIVDEKTSNLSDEALARLAANGNGEAFDEIYSRHKGFAYSVALRMTGNQADAEDLMQDAFVSVFRHVGSFRGDASFTTWLYRLVTNQVNMHFRYRSARPEIQASEAEVPEQRPSGSRMDPAEQLTDRLAIQKALRMLPPGYRSAFILYDIEGYKHDEVARFTGHTVGTSKSQLHKARAGLRVMLAPRSPVFQG
jgi:RNA polymerase sigma-70 factor (ECF subfamily)